MGLDIFWFHLQKLRFKTRSNKLNYLRCKRGQSKYPIAVYKPDWRIPIPLAPKAFSVPGSYQDVVNSSYLEIYVLLPDFDYTKCFIIYNYSYIEYQCTPKKSYNDQYRHLQELLKHIIYLRSYTGVIHLSEARTFDVHTKNISWVNHRFQDFIIIIDYAQGHWSYMSINLLHFILSCSIVF
jgi:hypothetical protein